MGLNNLTCVGEQWLVWPEICKEEKKNIYIYIYIYIGNSPGCLQEKATRNITFKKYHFTPSLLGPILNLLISV